MSKVFVLQKDGKFVGVFSTGRLAMLYSDKLEGGEILVSTMNFPEQNQPFDKNTPEPNTDTPEKVEKMDEEAKEASAEDNGGDAEDNGGNTEHRTRKRIPKERVQELKDAILKQMVPGTMYKKSQLQEQIPMSDTEWNKIIRELTEAGVLRQEGVKKASKYERIQAS